MKGNPRQSARTRSGIVGETEVPRLFGLSRSKPFRITRDFSRDVALLNAFNQRRLGLRAVPVAAITGTVGRAELCNPKRVKAFLATHRYQGMVYAMARGDGL